MFNDDLNDGIKSKRRKAMEELNLMRKLKSETKFEKNDFLALIIAALVTLLPVVIVILLLYFGISMLFFG